MHIVNTQLVNVNTVTGSIVQKHSSDIGQVIANCEMQHRVVPSATVANSANYPTIAAYLALEDTAGYSVIYMDQYTIITGTTEISGTVSTTESRGVVHHYNGTTPVAPNTNATVTFDGTTRTLHTIRNTHTLVSILRVSFDAGATFYDLNQGESLDNVPTAVDNIIIRSNVASCLYQILTIEAS